MIQLHLESIFSQESVFSTCFFSIIISYLSDLVWYLAVYWLEAGEFCVENSFNREQRIRSTLLELLDYNSITSRFNGSKLFSTWDTV